MRDSRARGGATLVVRESRFALALRLPVLQVKRERVRWCTNCLSLDLCSLECLVLRIRVL